MARKYNARARGEEATTPIKSEDEADKRLAEGLTRFFRDVLNPPQHQEKQMTNEEAFAEGMKKLVVKHPFLRLDLDWEAAMMIVGCLQLALRHPGNVGPSSEVARAFCDNVIRAAESVEPQLGELMRMGFDPQHDVPR